MSKRESERAVAEREPTLGKERTRRDRRVGRAPSFISTSGGDTAEDFESFIEHRRTAIAHALNAFVAGGEVAPSAVA